MDWLLLETQSGVGKQVIALRISDGDRRVVHRGEQTAPLRAQLDPTGRMVAVDVRARSHVSGSQRERAALVHLERGDRIWLPQALDRRWRLTGVRFDGAGRQLAFEGARGGADATDIYVAAFEVRGFSIRDVPVALLRHPHGLHLKTPTFIGDGDELLFFEERVGLDGYGLGLASLTTTEGTDEWPRVLSWTSLAADLPLIAERGLVFDAARRMAYVVARGRSGDSERVYRVPLDGGPATSATPPHGRIEALAVAPGEDRLAYAADEALRLVVGDADPLLLVRAPGGRFGGLLIDPESDCLWYAVNEPGHATLCAVLLPDGGVHPVARLNQERIDALLAVPDEPWLAEQLASLAAAPVLPSIPVVEMPTVVDQHHPVSGPDVLDEDTIDGFADTRLTASFGSLGTFDEEGAQPVTGESPSVFTVWMNEIAASGDPSTALMGLEGRRGEADLVKAARAHLERVMSSEVEGAPFFFAIAAVAHLGDVDARPLLRQICEPARQRVVHEKALPEAEEHFGLAALRYLDGHTDRFAAMVIYEEYETIIQQASGVLERDGGTAATKLVAFFLQLYAEQFADVLDPIVEGDGEIEAFEAFSRPPAMAAPVAPDAPAGDRRPAVAAEPPDPIPRDEESLEWRMRLAEAERVADDDRFRPFRSTLNRLPSPTSTPLAAEDESVPDFTNAGTDSVDSVDLRLSGIDGQRVEGPSWLWAAALAGGAAGLMLAVLSGALGTMFAVTGIAWMVGSVGLFANRRWGWILGLASYAANGALLFGYGIWGTPPQWITPGGLVLGGVGTFVVFALLLPHGLRRLQR